MLEPSISTLSLAQDSCLPPPAFFQLKNENAVVRCTDDNADTADEIHGLPYCGLKHALKAQGELNPCKHLMHISICNGVRIGRSQSQIFVFETWQVSILAKRCQ